MVGSVLMMEDFVGQEQHGNRRPVEVLEDRIHDCLEPVCAETIKDAVSVWKCKCDKCTD